MAESNDSINYALQAAELREDKKNFYDLDEVKAIPIERVCELYGIEIKGHNGKYYCSVRNENTPSVKLYIETNTFYDFGSGIGGDVIKFVSYITKCDWQLSLIDLANKFDIEPINNYDFKKGYNLSVLQYARINIQADLATKNFDIDMLKYGAKATQSFVDKYRMSVVELSKKYPEVYHNMLKKKAVPYVHSLRNDYYSQCYSQDNLYRECGGDILGKQENLIELQALCDSLLEAESILHKAITDTKLLNYSYRSYNVTQDIHDIRNGTLSFEVGTVEYADLKRRAAKNHTELVYNKIPADQYFTNNALKQIEHSAFFQGNMVNVAFDDKKFVSLLDNVITEHNLSTKR